MSRYEYEYAYEYGWEQRYEHTHEYMTMSMNLNMNMSMRSNMSIRRIISPSIQVYMSKSTSMNMILSVTKKETGRSKTFSAALKLCNNFMQISFFNN